MKQMLALAVMAAGLALGGRAWAEGLPKEDGTWTELAPMPTARHDFDIMVVGGKIYAVAGACEETMNVLEVYDPAGNTWSAAAAVPWPTAYYAGGVLDGRIYCAGGMMRTQVGEKQTTQAQANLSIYDTKTNQWTAGPPLSGPRSGAERGRPRRQALCDRRDRQRRGQARGGVRSAQRAMEFGGAAAERPHGAGCGGRGRQDLCDRRILTGAEGRAGVGVDLRYQEW